MATCSAVKQTPKWQLGLTTADEQAAHGTWRPQLCLKSRPQAAPGLFMHSPTKTSLKSRHVLWWLTASLAATAVIYAPGMTGPLLLDDFQVLVPLNLLESTDLFSREALTSRSGSLGRPISMTSFAFNSWLHGDEWMYWKALNVLLHLANGVLIFFLVRSLSRVSDSTRGFSSVLAFAVMAAWLLHPLNVSTVLYTVQRMAMLSTAFVLVGMLLYAHWRPQAETHWHVLRLLLTLIVCSGLAGFSKENGLMLPYFAVAAEYSIFASTQNKRCWSLSLGLAALTVLPLFAALWFFSADSWAPLLQGYVGRNFTVAERLLTESRAVVAYLKWIVVPELGELGFYHDDFRITRDLASDRAAALSILALLALISAAIAVRRSAPLVAFGVAWFFLALAMESTIFGLDLVFEHRTYMALPGLVMAIFGALVPFARTLAMRFAFVVYLFLLSGLCLARTQIWGEESTLYLKFFRDHPTSERAITTLSEWYLQHDQVDAALEVLRIEKTLTTDLLRQRLWCLRGHSVPAELNQLIARIEESDYISRSAVDAGIALFRASFDGYCVLPAGMALKFLESIGMHPVDATVRYRVKLYHALLVAQAGDRQTAIKKIQSAASESRSDAMAEYLWAEWACELGDRKGAENALQLARRRPLPSRFTAVDSAVAEMLASGCAGN